MHVRDGEKINLLGQSHKRVDRSLREIRYPPKGGYVPTTPKTSSSRTCSGQGINKGGIHVEMYGEPLL